MIESERVVNKWRGRQLAHYREGDPAVQLQTKRPTMSAITDYQSSGWASLNPFSLSLPLPFSTSHTSHLLFCRPAICPHSRAPRCKEQSRGWSREEIYQASCNIDLAEAAQKKNRRTRERTKKVISEHFLHRDILSAPLEGQLQMQESTRESFS